VIHSFGIHLLRGELGCAQNPVSPFSLRSWQTLTNASVMASVVSGSNTGWPPSSRPGYWLTRSGDQARIDDLARRRDVPGLPKHCIEALEQRPDGAGLREFLSEQPNRPGVGDAIRQSKSEKTHE
jgi:hypothetical protein